MGEIMLTIARVCRTIAVMTVTLAASLPFPEIAEAGNEGRPPRVGSYQHPRGNAHYQDHRGDRYQDHRSQQGDRNYGGAASSGTRIRCILPFCGNTFTPRGMIPARDVRPALASPGIRIRTCQAAQRSRRVVPRSRRMDRRRLRVAPPSRQPEIRRAVRL